MARESLSSLLAVAKRHDLAVGKRIKNAVKSGKFSGAYNPWNKSTWPKPLYESPAGHGERSKAHLSMGAKPCTKCFGDHTAAEHASHGIDSFNRTHGSPAHRAGLKGAKTRKANAATKSAAAIARDVLMETAFEEERRALLAQHAGKSKKKSRRSKG